MLGLSQSYSGPDRPTSLTTEHISTSYTDQPEPQVHLELLCSPLILIFHHGFS